MVQPYRAPRGARRGDPDVTGRLLLQALPDLLSPNHDPRHVQCQAEPNDRKRSYGEALVLGCVAGDVQDNPDGDQPHGGKDQRFIGS